MEYKTNKIDTERRKQINEAAKEGIIHGYDNISIYKNKERKNNVDNKIDHGKNKQKKLFIDATKTEKLEIQAIKEEVDSDKNTKGLLLDIKR